MLKRKAPFRKKISSQRRGVFDHLVVLLAHQLPVDRLAQDQLQVRIRICLPGFRSGQLLGMNRFQSWQKLESEQPTEGKRDLMVSQNRSFPASIGRRDKLRPTEEAINLCYVVFGERCSIIVASSIDGLPCPLTLF
jgi:hypothetical protein